MEFGLKRLMGAFTGIVTDALQDDAQHSAYQSVESVNVTQLALKSIPQNAIAR